MPNSGRARLVTGFAPTCFSASYTRKENRSGSARGRGRSPATATAKMFLAAKAAPNPPRPRFRPSSVRMEASRAPFLPATDGRAKLKAGPKTLRKPDTVRDHTSPRSSTRAPGHSSERGTTRTKGGASGSAPAAEPTTAEGAAGIPRSPSVRSPPPVSAPPSLRARAGSRSTLPSTTTTDHSGARPRKTSASRPAWRNRTPKRPPAFESDMVPVRGEGATAAKRPELGADVPVSGPAANTNGWLGCNGGSSGWPNVATTATPNPRPPTKARRSGGTLMGATDHGSRSHRSMCPPGTLTVRPHLRLFVTVGQRLQGLLNETARGPH